MADGQCQQFFTKNFIRYVMYDFWLSFWLRKTWNVKQQKRTFTLRNSLSCLKLQVRRLVESCFQDTLVTRFENHGMRFEKNAFEVLLCTTITSFTTHTKSFTHTKLSIPEPYRANPAEVVTSKKSLWLLSARISAWSARSSSTAATNLHSHCLKDLRTALQIKR